MDFWALGVLLFQCLDGSPPFNGGSEYLTFQLIKKRDFTWPNTFSPEAKDLIDKFLVWGGVGPVRIPQKKNGPKKFVCD